MSACTVIGAYLCKVVAFNTDDVTLTMDLKLEFGTIFQVVKSGHVAEVDFIPFAWFGSEDDGVGVDDLYSNFFAAAVDVVLGNAGIFDGARSATFGKYDDGGKLALFPTLINLEVPNSAQSVDMTFGPGGG